MTQHDDPRPDMSADTARTHPDTDTGHGVRIEYRARVPRSHVADAISDALGIIATERNRRTQVRTAVSAAFDVPAVSGHQDVSLKDLFEDLRRQLPHGVVGLNNNYTALYARRLIHEHPTGPVYSSCAAAVPPDHPLFPLICRPPIPPAPRS